MDRLLVILMRRIRDLHPLIGVTLFEQIQEAAREWLQDAIEDTAVGLACDLGYETFDDPGAEDWCVGDGDIHHAVREPLSYVAVMADFCKDLGIELPDLVAGALEETAAA